MKIYLIRHGEKEGHGFEALLTEKGKLQINNLAKNIINLSVTKIYSSFNPRSIESARIITKKNGMTFQIVENLSEFEKIVFSKDFEFIETNEKQNYQNLMNFIKKLEEKDEDVLLIMNAGINRTIMCYLLGYPLENAVSLTQDFASISELEKKEIYGKNVWCLNSINKTYND